MLKPVPVQKVISLEDALPIFNEVLKLYKSRWTLACYPWEDLAQDIRIHFCKKFHLYKQEKPLKPWSATLIQNFIKNELRNRYYIFQSPCLKCPMHLGESGCKKYGEVSVKCPDYKKFLAQKGNASNVNFPVSYENSNYDASQAFSCTPKDFTNALYAAISGVDYTIFNMFYESGFTSTKIARVIQVSGLNFKARCEVVESSLKATQVLAKDIILDKKISMGIDHE